MPARASIAAPTALAMALILGCHRPIPPERLAEPTPPDAGSRASQLQPWLDAWSVVDPRPVASSGASGELLEAPALRRLVLERHPAILAARAELAAAEAGVSAAGAWPNPELEGRYLFSGEAEGELEASLTITPPISGRLIAARSAARVERGMAELALESARHDALIQVDELLASLEHHRQHAALAAEVAGSSAQLADLVQQRRAAALADPLEVSIVLAEAARDAAEAAAIQAEREVVRGRLCAMAGLEPERTAFYPPPLEPMRLEEDRASLLAAAAEHSAPWVLARMELERAEWTAREASRARIPEPSLGPAVTGDPEQTSLGLVVAVPIPLLAPGTASYRAARAQRDAAHQRLIAAERETRREIDALLSRLVSLEAALASLTDSSLGSARQAARLARERYGAGQLDVLHLQSAQRAWAGLETDTLDLFLAIRHTQLALERRVGRPLQLTPVPTEPR
jgi:cobalt-zinc-cadmium efflux system outer membrane protein